MLPACRRAGNIASKRREYSNKWRRFFFYRNSRSPYGCKRDYTITYQYYVWCNTDTGYL